MSVTATYDFKLSVSDTIALGLDLVSDQTFTHAIDEDSGVLTGSTTPAVSKVWSDQVQLSGGALSLDLTNLSRGSVLSALDMTGLKVQLIKIKATSTNTDTVTVVDGATNGYNIFGSSSGSITLASGDVAMFFFDESLPDVASGAKTIDISSSDTDALVDIILVAG